MESVNLLVKQNLILSYRTCGLLRNNKKVLLQIEDGNVLIPGGHVEFMEDSKNALIREFKEELNLDIKINEFICFGEFLINGDFNIQQLNTFYEASCDNLEIPQEGEFELKDSDGKMQKFKWFDEDEINKLELEPKVLLDIIKGKQIENKHFVVNE